MAQNIGIAEKLYYNYENYKENRIQQRRFKHSDIIPLINEIKRKGIFSVNNAGKSVDGRDIFLLSIGQGKAKVFLWSQMHGDEATATMALFDVFNFFQSSDELNWLREQILNGLTIFFMPMVNPDGAELYQRRNIFEIDMNRDFKRIQTPESIILKKTFEALKADFAFNLHDQSTRYAAGNSFKSAAIAFLAPSFNHAKSVDSVRDNSIKLISELYNVLSHFIPGHIAKYKDDYEPRAFGDNFQKMGTSTILVESGLWKGDSENQFIRKLNFLTFIYAFYSISNKSYRHESIKTYDRIPQNEQRIFDLLLRNLKYSTHGKEILIDIGINRNEVNYNNARNFYYSSTVEDVGDLSVFYGFEDYDLSGYELHLGKTYSHVFSSLNEIKNFDLNKLYKAGYTNVLLKGSKGMMPFPDVPINIKLVNETDTSKNNRLLGRPANFIITKDGDVHFAVINGFFIGVKDQIGEVSNALFQ